jgi:hypothetical protein
MTSWTAATICALPPCDRLQLRKVSAVAGRRTRLPTESGATVQGRGEESRLLQIIQICAGWGDGREEQVDPASGPYSCLS